jgi:adenylate cyclase
MSSWQKRSEPSQFIKARLLRERAAHGDSVALEIERKFLVKHDGWKASVVGRARIRDGLITILNGRKTRVRILGDRATIAIKGPHAVLTRSEFGYPVPMADAEEMLRVMCDDRILEKIRHYVPHGAMTWEIDVYSGILDGVVIAEVELHREGDQVELPDWVGREVTGDVRYSKLHMLRERSGHTFDDA